MPDSKDDSEDISSNIDQSPDDITSIISGVGMKTIKTSIFIFILFILISSDVFVDRVLSTPDNMYAEGRHCNAKGTMVQGVLLSIGFILINTMVCYDYI